MSHQDRREPLPSDYQFPTHGVDCDCPPCRNGTVGVSVRFMREYQPVVAPTPRDMFLTHPFPLEPDENNLWGV